MSPLHIAVCVAVLICPQFLPALRAAVPPNPLVSVGKPVFSNFPAGLQYVNDGAFGPWMEGDPAHSHAWYAWGISTSTPAWVAIKVGKGYSKLLVQADTSCVGSHRPYDYLIETSADSTNGSDGTWTTVVKFAGKTELNFDFAPGRARNHIINFAGENWVRMSIASATKSPSDRHEGVVLDELSCFDASRGTSDSWFFVGDSITSEVFGHDFVSDLHSLFPQNTPCMVNGGIPGSSVFHWKGMIDRYLALYPDVKYWLIMLGTNDAKGAKPADVQNAMQYIVGRIKDAGHTAIIAKIPYNFTDKGYPVSAIQQFNLAIDELNTKNGLMAGPDFYTYFQSRQEMFRDKLHPNAAGVTAYRKLWVQTLSPLYRGGNSESKSAK